MTKIDYKKDLKHLYLPTAKEFTYVDVPRMNFLIVDCHGDPNRSPDFQTVTETLYAMSYTLKFMLKIEGADYVVAPLEGLWWMEDMAEFNLQSKDRWEWTLLMMQPEMVTQGHIERALVEVTRKRNLPGLPRLRFEPFHEGLAVQIMYFGAYADEGPTIARMHSFIRESSHEPNGKHHEIYLGDPRRTVPAKLKTVIRQPVKKVKLG